MKSEYDVIVVGGGGSGLAAAVSSAENGLEVLILEKQPVLGGTTGIAVGSLTACCTGLQQKNGIEDSLEASIEDVGKFVAPAILALDVYRWEPVPPDCPLLKLDNVTWSTHNAAGSPHFMIEDSRAVLENIARVSKGMEPTGRVA